MDNDKQEITGRVGGVWYGHQSSNMLVRTGIRVQLGVPVVGHYKKGDMIGLVLDLTERFLDEGE